MTRQLFLLFYYSSLFPFCDLRYETPAILAQKLGRFVSRDYIPSKIFFYQVWHETKDVSCSGNKHLFTKWCHRQTYLNYKQSQKNWAQRTLRPNIKSWSPSPIFFTEFCFEKFDQFSTLKNDFENQNFEMFKEVVYYFGKSVGAII